MLRSILIILICYWIEVEGLGGRGPSVALSIEGSHSWPNRVLHSQDNITLWCAPDNPQVILKKVDFVILSNKTRINGILHASKKNATLIFVKPTVDQAGEYNCEMDTQGGRAVHKISVYVRPYVLSSESFTVKDNDQFHLESTGQFVQRGGQVNLTCPVAGFPKPNIKWFLNKAPLEQTQTTIVIPNAEYEHGGLYQCTAVNEYTINGKTVRSSLTVERNLHVKSELAWVWPLATIIIILVLLGVTILFCEMRKRKLDKQSRYVSQE